MRLRSTAAAGVLMTAALSIGFSGTASAADLDCGNFATQAEAQAVLLADPSDPNRLDGNNNGQACEEYGYSGTSAPAAPTISATTGATTSGSTQVTTKPAGAVAAGDGSSSQDGSMLPYVLGGLAFAGAGGAAVAARRTRTTA